MATCVGNQKVKWYLGSAKIKKVYRGEQKLYSAGNIVTYYVDSSTVYQEEVEEGVSCLSPKTFTPTKSGWTFLGWRADKTASSSVLSSQVMGDAPVTLYAVFRATVIVKYYNNSTTASTTSGYRYYNNGNTVNPSFKLTQAAKSGWTARGWSTGTSGNSSITVANGASFNRAADITLYGMYQQTITLSYNGNGSTSGSVAAQSGIRYYNSNGNTVNPTFTLAANGFTRTGYTFATWALGAVGGAQYKAGASITLSASTTFYAYWIATAGTAFSYTGGIQTFTAPVSGKYQLEVYGAQGGNSPGYVAGGYGGYAKGNVNLTKGQVLYIVVGSKPSDGAASGGYNGGGGLINSHSNGGAGGGATHIAKRTGLLAALSSYQSDILIVAGGGGGSCYSYSTSQQGGAGGGTSGGATGTISGSLAVVASYGANQTRGGYVVSTDGSGRHPESQQGTFGQGGSGGAGGGGGYYGGGSGLIYHNPGTGGSGYTGGVSNGSMQNGTRSGNGYAKITFLE